MRRLARKFFGPAVRCAGLLALVFVLSLWLAGRSRAGDIIEFPIPTVGADPEGIVVGPDGAYWFVEFWGNRIGRIDSNYVFTEFSTNLTPSAFPTAITVGPDSNLWFTEFKGNKLGRITTNGVITEFPLPPNVLGSAITRGPDARLWIADFGAQTFIPGTPTNGGIIAITVGAGTNGVTATNYFNAGMTVHSRPANIVTGPDGNLWFTEEFAGRIGRITTNGVITEFVLPATNCGPKDIIIGPDGLLWFTEDQSNRLGRMDTVGNLMEFSLPTNTTVGLTNQPYGLLLGPDSNIWYTDFQGGHVSQVVVSGAGTNTTISATQFFTPTTNSYPRRLASGADGNIWFGEFPYGSPAFVSNIGKFVLVPPALTIQLLGTNAVLSWPTNATSSFVLQANPDLNPTNWSNVPNVPFVTNGLFVVTNSAVSNQFYRLKLLP